jgi:hypothetical protein
MMQTEEEQERMVICWFILDNNSGWLCGLSNAGKHNTGTLMHKLEPVKSENLK